MTRIAFVRVGNAGRSGMATAFANRERNQRGLDEHVEIDAGGTDPHDHLHDAGVQLLAGEGIDISDRTSRRATDDDVADADYVVTTGCSVADFTPGIGVEQPNAGASTTSVAATSASNATKSRPSRGPLRPNRRVERTTDG